MTRRLVAIHQPNLLPWLGFFDKIVRADTFVLLDDAQLPKTGGSWVNRVRVIVSGKVGWLTVPIDRAYHGVRQIREVQIGASQPWRSRMTRAVELSYAPAPYFAEVAPLFREIVSNPTNSLAEFNIAGLRHICRALELDTAHVVRASDIGIASQGTDRLIALTRAVGGDAYLCGGGADGYQDDAKFAEHGIELVYQRFLHPVYQQRLSAEFVPGLSILDAMMNCGSEGTRRLLRSLTGDPC